MDNLNKTWASCRRKWHGYEFEFTAQLHECLAGEKVLLIHLVSGQKEIYWVELWH